VITGRIGPAVRVHGVPESTDPPHTRRPLAAVLFDFHGTLAQVEDPRRAVHRAAAACGVALDPMRITALADALQASGWVGHGRPHRPKIPPHLAEVWADRDLSEAAHRVAFSGIGDGIGSGIEGFGDALHDRLCDPDGWVAYPDALPALKALRAAGIPVALVSNIGFDARTVTRALGLDEYIDAYALSYEVGRCKPDPAIFTHACRLLGVEPERTLMVGDNAVDAGAVKAGCVTLVLPDSPPGDTHGLAVVLPLIID